MPIFRIWEKKEWPDFLAALESESVIEATISALRLGSIFSGGDISQGIFRKGNKSVTKRLWKVAIKIPQIRTFILEQFSLMDKKQKRIQAFREWLIPNKHKESI